jgi:pentose-5-phosphate-3-epimerase/CBS domain-containing protein
MKISASIYSDKNRSLKETIQDLMDHHVDLFHVDCNDNFGVFEDIKLIRSLTDIPIDLHIITKSPSKYYDLLRTNPVEFLTFQYEDSLEEIRIPEDISGQKGLAVITPTEIDVFDKYSHFDFILVMATIPGQSGGVFDSVNFSKIRAFNKKYPQKYVHVDGGVNAEVSFILRNMGVSASVSGSYLFNAPSVGQALMNLTNRAIDSHFQVKDFMVPFDESPKIYSDNASFLNVLLAIEEGKIGFTLVLEKSDKFLGIISNADVRKGIINNFDKLNNFDSVNLVNKNALTVLDTCTVFEMLELIKKSTFPIMYLPVVDNAGKAVGIVTFVNLIKGEI